MAWLSGLLAALLALLVLAGVMVPERLGVLTRQAQLASLARDHWLYLLIVFSARVFLGALAIVLGPTALIFDTLTTALGSYINLLPAMSLRMSPFSQTGWVGDWTIFYWAW